MSFNLQGYETVKSRKKRFYADYPDGRIIVENESDNILEYAFIKATCYKTGQDMKDGLPFAQGYALELRIKEKTVSRSGKEYEEVNYSSWVENAEESAIGRCLDNASYSGNDKCSREEMQKVERMQKHKTQKDQDAEIMAGYVAQLQKWIEEGRITPEIITAISQENGSERFVKANIEQASKIFLEIEKRIGGEK